MKELNKLAVITINNLKKENVNSWGILKREVREALGSLYIQYEKKTDDPSYNNRGLRVNKRILVGNSFCLKTE